MLLLPTVTWDGELGAHNWFEITTARGLTKLQNSSLLRSIVKLLSLEIKILSISHQNTSKRYGLRTPKELAGGPKSCNTSKHELVSSATKHITEDGENNPKVALEH